MDFRFASAFEVIADTVPERPALVCGMTTRTWRAFDDRAARIASALAGVGLGTGSRVGIYLHNSNEYLETLYAAFKLGACPVNLSFRYKADDLVGLIERADVEALAYPSCYAARIWEIRKRIPGVKCYLEVADGTENIPVQGRLDYESAIRDHAPAARRTVYSDGEICGFYSSGTTAAPRLVTYAQEVLCQTLLRSSFAAFGVHAPENVAELPAVVRALHSSGGQPISLPGCPIVHSTSLWYGALMPLLAGGTVVTINRSGFDADLLWEEVASNKVSEITIGGDAFAKPMLEALAAAQRSGTGYDISSLRRIISTGATWRAATKRGLLEHKDLQLEDVLCSVEGVVARSVSTRAGVGATARFALEPGAAVFTRDGRRLAPGAPEVGLIVHEADVLREVDGLRFSFSDDYARVETDGEIALLGRASHCIDRAGVMQFPGVVEEVLQQHAAVHDCLVVRHVGEQTGQHLVALVSLVEAASDDEASILEFTRTRLADDELPWRLLLVHDVRRTVQGAPDYAWASREVAAQLS